MGQQESREVSYGHAALSTNPAVALRSSDDEALDNMTFHDLAFNDHDVDDYIRSQFRQLSEALQEALRTFNRHKELAERTRDKLATDDIHPALPDVGDRCRQLIGTPRAFGDHVCSQCRQLSGSLHAAVQAFQLSRKSAQAHLFSYTIADVPSALSGAWNRWWEPTEPTETDTRCPLCWMLSRSWATKSEWPWQSSQIRVFSFCAAASAYPLYGVLPESGRNNGFSSEPYSDALTMTIVPEFSPLSTPPSRGSEGQAVIVENEAAGRAHPSLRISPSFDTAAVLFWLSRCKDYHGKRCSREDLLPPSTLTLINCDSVELEDASDSPEYVALSYVWGSSGGRGYAVQLLDGRRRLPSSLPPVVNDAISVTKALGFRYLWIDKFCIDQHDEAIKLSQIAQMDAVYENAELTIIAAAGLDEDYGLPGVGTTPKSPQPVADMGGGINIMWAMRDPHRSIRESKWYTRGWTFQEGVLSRRRLVFTDEQVYWECNVMCCWESLSDPQDPFHPEHQPRAQRPAWHGMFGRLKAQEFESHSRLQYIRAIEDYTGRDLRYDTDSLHAFQGVIRHFFKVSKGTLLPCWGLPCLHPGRVAHVEGQGPDPDFVVGLVWTHVPGCLSRRRHDFPSWSWAGWAGRVQYGELSVRSPLFTSDLRSASVNLQSGDLQTHESPNWAYQINTFAKTLRMRGRKLKPEAFACDTGLFGSPAEWSVMGFPAALSFSKGGLTDRELLRHLRRGYPYVCVWVGSLSSSKFMMILEAEPAEKGVYTRAGMFVVSAATHSFDISAARFIDNHWTDFRVI